MSDTDCHRRQLSCRCASGIVWVRESHGVLLVDSRTGASRFEQGSEAMIWELLALNHSLPQITTLLSTVFGLSQQQAQAQILTALQQWCHDGFLEQIQDRADEYRD